MRSEFLVVDPVAGLALVAERLRRVVLTASFFPFVDFDGLAMSSPPHRSQCSSTVSRGHTLTDPPIESGRRSDRRSYVQRTSAFLHRFCTAPTLTLGDLLPEIIDPYDPVGVAL